MSTRESFWMAALFYFGCFIFATSPLWLMAIALYTRWPL